MKKEYVSPTFTKTMFISLDNISMDQEESQSLGLAAMASPAYEIFSNMINGVIFTDPVYDDCSCKKCFAEEMTVCECSPGC